MAHYYFENKPQPCGKNGKKISASLHADYICREKQYANIRGREEDLVYKTSGNLPVWAKGDAATFWNACETYKPENYRAYREFKFSLQEELSLEDNIAMVNSLIEKSGIGANHAYTFAIHDKPAAFDKNHRNIHCHLMFNEKIIERSRQLPADTYFAKYAQNKNGELTGGLRTSIEFISKQKTFELRTMWADIVNAKFAERGINASVDERTLTAQKEELIALGRMDEAEYFDREPAPHLGKSYRNPKTLEKIREKIEQLENCPEDEEYKFDEELTKDASDENKKILVFAKDFLLRKLGKAIQKEREKLQAEMELANSRVDNADEFSYAVTAGDLAERISVLANAAATESSNSFADYQKIAKTIVKENYIENEAAYAALGDDGKIYRNLRLEYSTILKDLKAAQEKRDTALARAQSLHGDVFSVAEWQAEKEKYYAAKKEVSALFTKRTKTGSKIAVFKKRLDDPVIAALVKEYTEEIQENNKIAGDEAKGIYKKYIAKKKLSERYNEVLKELSALDNKTVIFAAKIPPMLQTYSKLLGTVPVNELDKLQKGKETYYILQKDTEAGTALAVKLHDDIIKGKVPVYQLNIKPDDKGKETIEVKITGKISTYAQNDTLQKQAAKGQQYPAQTLAIERKLTEIASQITENKNMRIDAWWPDERTGSYDKLQEAEHRMTQGWSL